MSRTILSSLANNRELVNTTTKNGIVFKSMGVDISGDPMMNAQTALQMAKADFEVVKRPIFALPTFVEEAMANGEMIDPQDLLAYVVSDKSATMRTDNQAVLGVVGSNYGVVQNQHAFDFVDMLTTGEIGGEKARFQTAGVFGKGERIFCSAKFAESLEFKGDKSPLDFYVVFTTSHDGMGAVACVVTPVRVVCNNTLNLAMQNNVGKITFRHTSQVMSRLDVRCDGSNEQQVRANIARATSTIEMLKGYKESLEQKIHHLTNIKLMEKEVERIVVEATMPADVQLVYKAKGSSFINDDSVSTRAKNIYNDVRTALESGVGQAEVQSGNAYWLTNGITTYFQNVKKHSDLEKKFDSITEGQAYKTLNKVVELAEAI